MRLAQTAVEQNIARKILPAIPHQSFILSELELIRRLHSMAELMQSNDHQVVVSFTFDFTKWNCQFREELVEELFKSMDKIFGMKRICQSAHLLFEKMAVFWGVKTQPPLAHPSGTLPLPSLGVHFGQQGGFEGLKQKSWTIATGCLIDLSLKEVGLRATLLGSGDNQIAVTLVHFNSLPTEMDLKVIADRVLETLTRVFDEAGLPLKPLECWYSTTNLAYNKIHFISGSPCSNGLKRALKLNPDTNELFPSLNGEVTTLGTGAESIAKEDVSPFPAYYMYALELSRLFLRRWKKFQSFTTDQQAAILLWGRAMGGFPGSTFANMCYRGHPDRLTQQLTLIRTARKCDPQVHKSLSKLCARQVAPILNKELLIKDPYALNLVTPPQPENKIKDLLISTLRSLATNPTVTLMFSLADKAPEDLYDDLVSMDPCYPRVANLIYAKSVVGQREAFCGKFERSRSVVAVAGENYSEMLLFEDIKKYESVYLSAIPKFLSSDVNERYLAAFESECCSSTLANELREDSWGKPILGVTVSIAAEQITPKDWDISTQAEKQRSICTIVSKDLLRDPTSAFTKRGPFMPYHGSRTARRAQKTSPLSTVESTPQLRAVQELLSLRNWTSRISNKHFVDLLDELISERLELPEGGITKAEFLDLVDTPVYGGQLSHRVEDPAGSHACLSNERSSVSSHIMSTSTGMSIFPRGGEDGNILYQSLYLYICGFLSILLRLGIPLRRAYAFVFSCAGCTIQVKDNRISLPEAPRYRPTVATKSETITLTEIGSKTPRTDAPECETHILLAAALAKTLGASCNRVLLLHRVSILIKK